MLSPLSRTRAESRVTKPSVSVVGNFIEKNPTIMVGPDKPAIVGRCCFELVISHHQGIRITCLAHHPALYTQGECIMLWFCDIRTNETHQPLDYHKHLPQPIKQHLFLVCCRLIHCPRSQVLHHALLPTCTC